MVLTQRKTPAKQQGRLTGMSLRGLSMPAGAQLIDFGLAVARALLGSAQPGRLQLPLSRDPRLLLQCCLRIHDMNPS